MKKNIFFSFSFLLITFFSHYNLVFAGGFVIYNQDAAATGVGGAFTAQADNPSAVLYNPAAINQLSGTNISFGNTIVVQSSSFKNLKTNTKTNARSHIYLIPNFYITHKINEEFSVGLGSFSYFGLATDWPDNWEGKFISTYSSLKTFFLNPVISYQVTPKLSFAFGIAPFYSAVRQKKALGIAPLPFSFGTADLDADGYDVTYNLALLYHVSNNIKFGFSFRSGVNIEYNGDINFKAPPLLKKFLPKGGVSLDMNLPALMTTGVSYDITDYCTLEFDLYWQGWSTYDQLKPEYDKPVPSFLKKSFGPINRNYHNILDYCLGIKFQINPYIVFRSGYFYDHSPVPEKTVDPVLPDADKNTLAVGLGYENKKYKLDFTYYAVFSKDRKTTNNLDGFNGTYRTFAHIISSSFIYKF